MPEKRLPELYWGFAIGWHGKWEELLAAAAALSATNHGNLRGEPYAARRAAYDRLRDALEGFEPPLPADA